MSRVEENNKLSIPHHLSSNNDNATVQIECAKMQYLLDISRSLALIADKIEPGLSYKMDAYREYLQNEKENFNAVMDHWHNTEEDNDGK